MSRRYDVVVAGAGPAGSVAALALARAGARVALIEKGRFPRDKLCGGFLSGEAAALLARLGLEARFPVRSRAVIDRLAVTAPRGIQAETPLPGDGPAWGIARRVLDEALASAAAEAGVELITETIVASVEQASRSEEGPLTVVCRPHGGSGSGERLRAAHAVAADGRDRGLARRFGPGSTAPGARAAGAARRPFGIQAFFEAPATSPRTVEVHFAAFGYLGLQPVGDGLVTACALVHPEADGTARTPDALVERFKAESEAIAGRLRGALRVSPWLAVGGLRFGARGPRAGPILCAGDAAGSIEPFTGEGMSIAIASGLLAAGAILEAPCDPASVYVRRWNAAFAARLRACRLLAAASAWQPLQRTGLRVLAAHPAFAGRLVAWTRTAAPGTGAPGALTTTV